MLLPFNNFTGRGVRVAIIDSGVNPAHPHVAGVAGGVHFNAAGVNEDYLDYIGHGTAVAGAIREKAPEAALYAVKVFDQALRTKAETIIRALEWALEHEMQVVNLSLGTLKQTHYEQFARLIQLASAHNLAVVAARAMAGEAALPGCLPEVIAAGLDWECPRESYGCALDESGVIFLASGYARAIPGVPPERNLKGISFAVANLTGFVVRARQAYPAASVAELAQVMREAAAYCRR